jgi:hypothetical protein
MPSVEHAQRASGRLRGWIGGRRSVAAICKLIRDARLIVFSLGHHQVIRPIGYSTYMH